MALDLESCGRCARTLSNLDAALGDVAQSLGAAKSSVHVQTTVVRSAQEAERLRFLSSPTIRVNGRDIALDLRESACGDCTTLAGCASDVDCRVWVWRGREYQDAPREMIADAILRAVREGEGPAPAASEPYRLPENLHRFFEARSRKCVAPKGAQPCCAPSEPKSCCPHGKSAEGSNAPR